MSAGATLRRLEDAFNLLEGAKISLSTFERIVVAEREALARAQLTLPRAITAGPYAGQNSEEGITESIKVVDWCLSWIEEMKEGTPSES